MEEGAWLTLFFLRVLRFSNKHYLHCASCGAALLLTPTEFQQMGQVMRQRDSIAGTQLYAALGGRIEKVQLAGKTATQIKFIRESLQRAEQDRQAADVQRKR